MGTDFDLDGGLIPALSQCITTGTGQRYDPETETILPVTHTLRGEGFDASEDGTGRGTPLVPVAFDVAAPVHAIQAGALRTNPTSGPDGVGVQADHAYTLEARAEVQAVQSAMQVRRLTPTEAERLQGFPDIKKTYTIEVCHEAEKPENAPSAEQSSAALSHAQSRHAAVRVRINLERQEVHLLSPARLNLSANTVGNPSMYRPLMRSADIAHLVALMTPHLDRITGVGKGGSQANTTGFSPRLSGSRCVQLFGQEIDELASDVDKFTSTVSACLKSITSEAGQSSPSYERSLQTLCCCVVAAINSCIQGGTPTKSSYALSIETEIGYTAIPWRGKPADQCPDGPRYRALGNSWAVPVVAWIGKRIAGASA